MCVCVCVCVCVYMYQAGEMTASYYNILCYSYTIALSGLFELYVRGGCLKHEAKLSGLNTCLERTIQ